MFGVETGAWAGFEVGVQWETGSVDVEALFEEGVSEVGSEAGVGVWLGSGQDVTGLFAVKPGSDCEFGEGVVGTVAGARHYW